MEGADPPARLTNRQAFLHTYYIKDCQRQLVLLARPGSGFDAAFGGLLREQVNSERYCCTGCGCVLLPVVPGLVELSFYDSPAQSPI